MNNQIPLNKSLEYYEGYKQALHDYAIMRDGVYYVGCGVYLLKDVLEEINEITKYDE